MPYAQTGAATEPSYWISAVTMQLILSQQPQQWQQQQLGRRPRNCGKRHTQSSCYLTSSLLTRFSTWLSLPNISRFVSLMSTWIISKVAAICSTLLVSFVIAMLPSILRLLALMPITATADITAPTHAATSSIMGQQQRVSTMRLV